MPSVILKDTSDQNDVPLGREMQSDVSSQGVGNQGKVDTLLSTALPLAGNN